MGSGRFQPLKSRKSRLLRRPQGILPDRLLGSSVERMHLAAKLEFERTVRESARCEPFPSREPAWNNRCRLLVLLVRLS